MSDLKPCPFCGSNVEIEKRPLWEGSHGYHGCYEFVIKCPNASCGCRINFGQNDTIYRDEHIAKANAIEAWNRRAQDERLNKHGLLNSCHGQRRIER